MIRNYQLNKNPPIAGLDRIRTIDIYQKTWGYLKRYQSYKYVRNKLEKEIVVNKNLVKIKSEQISSLMVQCESYYHASKDSPLEIKPLLLYYGMVGLSKCLILSGDNDYTLSALSPSNKSHSTHGLTVSPNSSSQRDKTIRDSRHIYNEFCYVFTSTKNLGLYNLLRSCFSDTTLPCNTRLDVKTLLSYVPELYKDYHSYFRSKPNTWHCDSHFGVKTTGDTLQIIEFRDWDYVIQKKGKEKYINSILRCFPELKKLFTPESNSEDRFLLNNGATSIDDCIYISPLLTLESYALRRFKSYAICDFDVHFTLMYILSNLVRYRQDKWSRLIRRVDNDEMFLIESFIEISYLKYPYLILRELENCDYVFTGQVAIWG